MILVLLVELTLAWSVRSCDLGLLGVMVYLHGVHGGPAGRRGENVRGVEISTNKAGTEYYKKS